MASEDFRPDSNDNREDYADDEGDHKFKDSDADGNDGDEDSQDLYIKYWQYSADKDDEEENDNDDDDDDDEEYDGFVLTEEDIRENETRRAQDRRMLLLEMTRMGDISDEDVSDEDVSHEDVLSDDDIREIETQLLTMTLIGHNDYAEVHPDDVMMRRNNDNTSTPEAPPSNAFLLLSKDDMENILLFVGARQTMDSCPLVCKSWHQVICGDNRNSLWKNLLADCVLGIPMNELPNTTDWFHVFRYIQNRDGRPRLPFIPPRSEIIWVDDGGHVLIFAPTLCIQAHPSVWRPRAEKNIDLVLDFHSPCLFSSFDISNAVNHHHSRSNPLQTALVFVSLDLPDLDATKYFEDEDGRHGQEWVAHFHNRLEEPNLPEGIPKPLLGVRLAFRQNRHFQLPREKFVVGRYVHYKLLSAHQNGATGMSVAHLFQTGVVLRQLPFLLGLLDVASPRVLPYKLKHIVDDPNEPLGDQPLFEWMDALGNIHVDQLEI